jgi:hypothetical protein
MSVFPTFLEFDARAKIGTIIMAKRDFRGIPRGTLGRVIGIEEQPSGGYDLRILWLAEELPGRKKPFIEWFTRGEYERLLVERKGYAIMTAMKERDNHEDDFWTEHIPLFTAQFPTYSREPQQVYARFHTSDEQYFGAASEIVPLKHKKGTSTYIMMHPYVREPNLTLTIGLYNNLKQYADQESPIGEVLGSQHEGFREAQAGNAQAWYYHQDKTIVLWECFFDERFLKHPLTDDANMQHLWKGFEHWLVEKFPHAKTIATPFNDPIAESIEEYQAFLKTLGYSPLAQGAFGKNR